MGAALTYKQALAGATRLFYVREPHAGGHWHRSQFPPAPKPMSRLAVLVFGVAMTLALPNRAVAQSVSPLPCSDSLYVALKRKPVDSLSAREYELFRERDRACLQSAGTQASGAPTGPAVSSDAVNVAAAVAGGRELAASEGTGGWFAGGVGSGLVLGLIGTAIITVAANNSGNDVPASQQSILATKPPDYSEAFARGYREKLKSKKRTSALTGGLLGTAAFLAIYVSAQGSD